MSAKRPRRQVVSSRTNEYLVFISHATVDKWLATVLCEKIEAAGARTFRDDRDINGGDDIPDSLRDAIAGANEMVVLLTPASVNRPWVLMEIGAAWQRGPEMRIVGVRQHVEIEPIPDMLKSKKVIDLNDFDQYLQELADRVRKSR
jgi:hypothetical protein